MAPYIFFIYKQVTANSYGTFFLFFNTYWKVLYTNKTLFLKVDKHQMSTVIPSMHIYTHWVFIHTHTPDLPSLNKYPLITSDVLEHKWRAS